MTTMQNLRDAKRLGRWQLKKNTLFHLRNYNDQLFKPNIVLKTGTVVEVQKVYRRGRAALLHYRDRSGKVWWSWTHATVYEPVRKYKRRVKDNENS